MRAALRVGYWAAGTAGRVTGASPAHAGLDLALFPYYPRGNPGFRTRFDVMLPLLEADGVRYRVFEVGSEDETLRVLNDPARQREQYLLYARMFWRRMGQIVAARGARVAFVQRGIFPYYPERRPARLEGLLRRSCGRIVLDYYDADYVHNPDAVRVAVAVADSVTAATPYLADHFARLHGDVALVPLAIEVDRYVAKRDYALSEPARVVWAGSVGNANRLRALAPALQAVAASRPLELVIVCPAPVELPGLRTSHVWPAPAGNDALTTADVALYPADPDSVTDRAKCAFKVLEYMATGLPIAACPAGVPSAIRNGENALVVQSPDAWVSALQTLLGNQELRERLGRAARAAALAEHSPEASYARLRAVLRRSGVPVRDAGDDKLVGHSP